MTKIYALRSKVIIDYYYRRVSWWTN